MRIVVSLLLTVAIGMGVYALYLKSTVSSTGGHPVSAISTTHVKMQLLQIAQAERAYSAQNGSYATIDQLASSGSLTLATPDPDGYSYSVDASAGGFTATARHTGGESGDAPTMTIDQTMAVEGGN
jgi:type IV minor pilin ComP (DNA uptake receptor)